ncbi:ribose/galactose isomerase [Desulfosoma caldarium]|uniref:Ribose/galactose isomerase n=1 Tax=Desulfosoma caldarium TaxID=610254 RepID=A0A3N1UEK0_9BACT|nr:ribose/galactose isomerase [Desulfosoma caldarium]
MKAWRGSYRFTKEMIKPFLGEIGHEVYDFGTHSDTPVDCSPFLRAAAKAVQKGACERGIVLGAPGTGRPWWPTDSKGFGAHAAGTEKRPSYLEGTMMRTESP